MANVIRHKRGTSDPAAGDFSGTGELLVNTTDGGLFTLTDSNTVVEVGSTSGPSASELLTSIKTVDGSGSGLDADLLDGVNGASYLRSDTADTFTGSNLEIDGINLTFNTDNAARGNAYFRGSSTHLVLGLTSGNTLYLNYGNSSGAFRTYGSVYHNDTFIGTPWGSSNDGSGSGLDADLLDGQQGSYFLNYNNFTNTPTIPTNNNQLTNGAGYITSADGGNAATVDGLDSTQFLRADTNDTFSGSLTGSGSAKITFGPNSTWSKYLVVGGNGYGGNANTASMATTNGNLHLDAATGSTTYLNYYAGTSGVVFGNGSQGIVAWMGPDGDLWKGSSDNSGSKYWHAGNDGSGSGLDADLLDGQQGSYYAPKASPALTGTPTAPTAAAGTNTTQVATTAFVSTAVANVIDSAPAALDTLNELAAALGDDANFSTTVTNSIAAKLPLSGGQMTGNITFSSTQTVDGRDLSVDGAKLDGIAAGAEVNVQSDWNATSGDALILNKPTIPTNNNQLTNGAGYTTHAEPGIFSGGGTPTLATGVTGAEIRSLIGAGTSNFDGAYSSLTGTPTIPTNNNQLTNGAGYITSADGGNAATLDGVDSTQFLRSDAADFKTAGTLRFDDNIILAFGTGYDAEFFCNGTDFYLDLNAGINNFIIRDGTTTRFTFDDAGDFTATGNVTAYSDINLKENIEVIPNAVEKVSAIRGVTFDRKDVEGPRFAGVIAQEVEAVLPEVVRTDEEGVKSVAYGNLVGLLVEAIKEQQEQINKLTAEVEKLKGA